jgi:hypothetical protein
VGIPLTGLAPLHVCVTKYLFWREICFAGTYFTENMFCQNFLNEKLVPEKYFIGKFILPI